MLPPFRFSKPNRPVAVATAVVVDLAVVVFRFRSPRAARSEALRPGREPTQAQTEERRRVVVVIVMLGLLSSDCGDDWCDELGAWRAVPGAKAW